MEVFRSVDPIGLVVLHSLDVWVNSDHSPFVTIFVPLGFSVDALEVDESYLFDVSITVSERNERSYQLIAVHPDMTVRT